MAEPTGARRTFGPVVLLGLAAAGLAAYAGGKPWLDVEKPGGECRAVQGFDYSSLALGSPLAAALALVVLAGWGVLLVTRGRFRRAVAVLTAIASLGYLATAVEAYWSLKPAAAANAVERVGGGAGGCPAASIWMDNQWWPAALVLGVVCTAVAVLAVVVVPSWPEMGTKYDAPAGVHAPEDAADDAGDAPVPTENIDIWKALDEGRDPTA